MKAKTPKIPPRPKVLSADEGALRAEEEARRRLRDRIGRKGTVLTSALGDPQFGTSAFRRGLTDGSG